MPTAYTTNTSASRKRPREEDAAAETEGANATSSSSSSELDLSEICAIDDQGEIYFQACFTCVDLIKKLFKDLGGFLKDFQFVLSPDGTIEIFDYNAHSHDGVDCKIYQSDYFFSSFMNIAPRKFSFVITARELNEKLSCIPMTGSVVLIFYISENCVNQNQEVFQLSLRAINLQLDYIHDHYLKAKTGQHASLFGNLNCVEGGDDDTGGDGEKEDAAAATDEMVDTITRLSRVECQKHHCIVEWGIKNFKTLLDNSGVNSKEASVIMMTANNGERFHCDCPTGSNESRSRALNRHVQISKFIKFDPPSVICPIVTNSFRVQSVVNFMKCGDLCDKIRMYLDQTMPLVMEFEIAGFATLRLFTPAYEKPQN